MHYSLVHFVQLPSSLARFRMTYNPYAQYINPHIPFIFPLPPSLPLPDLVNHIDIILSKQKPFEVELHHVKKLWDHWFVLLVNKGKSPCVDLHKKLYQ